VERANQSIKDSLHSLEQQERGNADPNWTQLLGQTKAAENGATGYGLENQAPHVHVPFNTPLLASLEQLRAATTVHELDHV
jgi:hypothetical protein